MNTLQLFWLSAAVIFAIAEAVTVSLVSVWFCIGGIAALLAGTLGAPLWVQLVLFFVISAVLLALLRPISRRLMKKERTPTNADRNIGRNAIVSETIDNLAGKGAVKIDGIAWSARSTDDSVIREGTTVSVQRIEGVKVIVKAVPAEDSENKDKE